MSRARISDLLKINPRFLRSVNLERDFGDALALEGYVATAEASKHLQRIGRGLRPESGERAWRITGDFGAGKSSFALVLASLLGRSAKELPENIRALRSELGLRNNAPKLVPVLVTGAREPLAFAVLRGLQAALNRSSEARKSVRVRGELERLIAKGQASDRQVLELIEQTSEELVSRGQFGGILLIIDELGKFLEFAALHPEQQDVYFLQTIAENSSRSGSAPVYTLGLLHQGFAEYAEKLPSTAQLEWAKISERFGEIAFSQPLGQVATLIAAALSLDSDNEALWGWKGRSRAAMGSAIGMGMFGPSASKTFLTEIAPELYPIHPTVIPVLARFFRRFGQNERSLFSFLLSSEPYALPDFGRREASPDEIYRLADFYDFAANNFAYRLGNQSFRSHWNHIDARVRSAENEPDVQRILKTVGILNVIHSSELYPTEDVLELALGDHPHLVKSLKALCKRGILFNRGRAGYSLWPHASVNLEQRIEEAREKLTHASPIAQVVREKLDSRPIVARRHYIRTGNLRHFDVRFITGREFASSQCDLSPLHPADGVVAVVLCESAAERRAAEKEATDSLGKPDLIVAVSAPLDTLSPTSLELERWEWIERNTPELKDDRFAAEEVSRQIEASRQLLESRLREFVGFRDDSGPGIESGISWFYEGKRIVEIGRDISLQSYLSDLCYSLFDQAPEVRNELVNRHAISAAAASARQKLFKAMLECATLPLLGLPEEKAPPEKSMYLSLLQAGKIHTGEQDTWEIQVPENEGEDPLNLRPAFNAIMARLEEVPDQRVPVGELYALLRSRPYGVRDGLIPILLLTVLIVHETEIAVYEDDVFQPQIEEFLMMRFARTYQTFEFQLCRITGVRKALISELAAVVEADQADKFKLLSIVRPLYLFVADLPDYARNTEQLTSETLAVRKAIQAAREPADLVFRDIPQALGFDPKSKTSLDAAVLAKKLRRSITELRRCFPELQTRMSTAILQAFQFAGDLDEWRQSVSGSAETVLVGLGDPEFRAFCLKLIMTESPQGEWLESLGSLLTRCPPSRWKDREELVFNERIHAFAAQFNRVLATCFLRDGSLPETAIRLAVTPRSGVEKNLVISLNPAQTRESDRVLGELRKHLPANSQISLAALTRLLWDILPKDE